MKLRDFAPQLHVDPEKLTSYALYQNHPKGKHKAHVFADRLGFTVENYEPLLRQIETRALDNEAELLRTDQYGQHIRVDLIITGISGQEAVVRTGWLVGPSSDIAVLSTLYVRNISS